MDKSGAKFKFVGHSTEIIRQSKNKGTLTKGFFQLKVFSGNFWEMDRSATWLANFYKYKNHLGIISMYH